ncbi:integral membrane mpv17 pmp22 family [Diplodia corticola]|uniref:Integral membrane mpv17 pmp22 family n=1 Tax=Diplodia corticola TaxID=236234 RepID=A0A1J9RMG4_9PEZI|nr:integral membrane mpv17 pmp22 family [Diplodia corticola]OJD29108.1 integral membrane mpv17 pmp22 family [Diplodia corticola]
MPSPMVQQTITAAALSAASNILAQLITAQKTGRGSKGSDGGREGQKKLTGAFPPSLLPSGGEDAGGKTTNKQQTFTIDAEPVAKFVLFTALSTPPNVLWQEFLEDVFPGEKKKRLPPTNSNDNNSEKKDAQVKDERKNAGMDWANVFWKFLLDQTVGGVVNTVLFIAGMKALNGGDAEAVKVAVKEGLWPIFLAGTKLWPLVSIISFTLIPVEKRVVFGSIIGVAWGVYLSLIAAQ